MKNNRRIIMLVVLLCNCIFLSAQQSFNYSISGSLPSKLITNVQDEGVHEIVLSDATGNEIKRVTATPKYAFKNLAAGQDYVISVEYKSITTSSDLTTFGFVKMDRHIKAIDFINYPYDLIAADVNRDNTLTQSDQIMFRHRVLNLPTPVEFLSYRYIPANHIFAPQTNPSIIPYFPESVTISNLSRDISGVDFIAIKLGSL